MEQDKLNAMLNPNRMRIVQQLMIKGESTALELAKELTDIPQATLYRHINNLCKNGMIGVKRENRVRGTVEKVYELVKAQVGTPETKEDALELVTFLLLNVMQDFKQYIKNKELDLEKDVVMAASNIIMLDEEETRELAEKMMGLVKGYIGREPNEQRRARKLSIFAVPVETEKKKSIDNKKT